MDISESLPDRYRPYHVLNLCSNRFENVSVPIAVRDFPALLLGRGKFPLVWIAAPRSETSLEWTYVVRESRAMSPGVQVKLDKTKGEVTVTSGGVTLLRAKTLTPDEVDVLQLDLRPVGLRVVGDRNTLQIGNGEFSRNTIKSARVGISLG